MEEDAEGPAAGPQEEAVIHESPRRTSPIEGRHGTTSRDLETHGGFGGEGAAQEGRHGAVSGRQPTHNFFNKTVEKTILLSSFRDGPVRGGARMERDAACR